jgi:hypothetical protein
VGSALIGYVVEYSVSERHTLAQAEALNLAEAAMDRAAYQLNVSSTYAGETNTPLGSGTFSVVVTNIDGVTKQITATGYIPNSSAPTAYRVIRAKVVKSSNSVTFHYGTQAGQGGIIFSNNAGLIGNLFSNGNVIGSNGAYITGDTFVAGATGLISGMCIGGTYSGGACTNATGSGNAGAHTITSTQITGTPYCQSGTGNNKACDTSLPDASTQPLPIDDSSVTQWESDAAAGTIINGNYSVSSGSVTLGPTKIIGNLSISGNAVVTLNNTVWVTGNVSFSGSGGGSKVKLANTYGAQSGLIIANGLISIGNNITFQDSGTSGSYIMLLSTSTCDESTVAAPCGSKNAIDISNNAAIVIAAAENGTVNFANNASVKEVVGNLIRLKNNVVIQYGSGLPSTLFQSGPGGSWQFEPGTYAITH